MYDPKSLKAEEFICHEEIEDTLKYADENKDNLPLIREILDKARLCKGLSHREASVLLACEDPEILDEIYKLANEIKHKFYGNRIVMFAPLYLSNYCVNGCTYCPYHRQNHHIPRRKLTQEEVAREVVALQDMGHKRLAIEAGEDPKYLLRRLTRFAVEDVSLADPNAVTQAIACWETYERLGWPAGGPASVENKLMSGWVRRKAIWRLCSWWLIWRRRRSRSAFTRPCTRRGNWRGKPVR